MSNKIITSIQEQLITLFRDAKEASEAQNEFAPKAVKPYSGELSNPKRKVRVMPSIYVDVTSDFTLDAVDTNATMHDGTYAPEIILFDTNATSASDTYGEMAVLIDWVIDALRGKTITVDGQTLLIAEQIQGRYLQDIIPAAVLTLNIRTHE